MLTSTGWAEHQGVVAGVNEAQRAQLVPDLVVEADLGRGVPVLQAHIGVEAGGPRPQRRRGRPRLVTSSDSTSSKKSAWAMSALLARASRSGKVSRQRPSFTCRSTVFSSAVMTGVGTVIATLPGARGWPGEKRPLRWP